MENFVLSPSTTLIFLTIQGKKAIMENSSGNFVKFQI